MQNTFARTISVLIFLFFLAAACVFCFAFAEKEVASAEETVYNLGQGTLTVTFTYGETVTEKVRPTKKAGEYYKIVNYVASPGSESAAAVPLTTAGVISASPGTIYYMAAGSNTVPCQADGTALEDARCEGTLRVVIGKKTVDFSIPSEYLSKTYGETPEAPPSVQDGDLTVTFSSDGLKADAPVKKYSLSVLSCTRSGTPIENYKDYYDFSFKNEETGAAAEYTVTPKAISFAYDEEDAVRFNDYLLDGESVAYRTEVAPSGETLTAYFKIYEEHAETLTVGQSYAVELVRYVVAPAEGDPLSVSVTEKEQRPTQGETVFYENPEDSASNFTVSVTYQALTVKATAGSVTIYQDETLKEERKNDPSYCYLPLSTFRYTYLDLIYTDKGEVFFNGNVLDQEVTFYPGVTGTVRFSLLSEGVQAGTMPAGSYAVACRSFSCDAIETLSFDDTVRLVVEKLKLTYEEKPEVQYPLSDTYEMPVTVDGYDFAMVADLSAPEGESANEYLFTSATPVTDPSVELDFSKARVVLIKRTDGVSLVGASEAVFSYGDAVGDLALPQIEIDGVTRPLTQTGDGVTLSYATEGIGKGLPTEVGTYKVTCTLDSEHFTCDPLIVTVQIKKKKIVLCVRLSADSKVYGTAFDFGSSKNVQIFKYYPVKENGETDLTAGTSIASSSFAGTLAQCAGGAADAKVDDDYKIDWDISSGSYEVTKVLYFVGIGESERPITRFSVTKADRPPTPSPTYEVKDRTIEVSASGKIRVRISRSENMSSAETVTGKNATVVLSEFSKKKFLYGEVFYLQVCTPAGDNYVNDSDWSETRKTAIPFVAPALLLDESKTTTNSATFLLENDDSPDLVSDYVIRHRVGSGAWQDGLVVTGLKEDTSYTVSFRLEKGEVVGAVTNKSFRTNCAPVAKSELKYTFDRTKGTLSLSTERTGLEYRLCLPSGEEVVDWTDSLSFENLLADSKYLLQVRYAKGSNKSSEITEIVIDTHKKKEPLTVKGVLRDWFLAFVGGGLLLFALIFIVAFVKKKRRLDREAVEKR